MTLSINSYAKNIYFSLSPTLSLENFDLKGEDETIEKEESWGFNFKFGINVGKYISLELDYDYIAGFTGTFDNVIDNIKYTLAADIQIDTIIPMFKTSVGSEKLKNYFSTGLGYMEADYGFNKSDVCWKLGTGFDYFFTEGFSLGANINYIVGLGDVKFIEYYNGSLGLSYNF